MRRRDEATFWAAFFDAAQPERYVEYWIVDPGWSIYDSICERRRLITSY
jgi:hypothetical protein